MKYDFRIFSKEQTIILPPIDGENPGAPIISSNSNFIIITVITLSSLIALIFLIWLFIYKRRKFLKFYDESESKNNSINVSTNKVENIQENNKINLERKDIVSVPLLNEEKYLISNKDIKFIKEENNVEKKIISDLSNKKHNYSASKKISNCNIDKNYQVINTIDKTSSRDIKKLKSEMIDKNSSLTNQIEEMKIEIINLKKEKEKSTILDSKKNSSYYEIEKRIQIIKQAKRKLEQSKSSI